MKAAIKIDPRLTRARRGLLQRSTAHYGAYWAVVGILAEYGGRMERQELYDEIGLHDQGQTAAELVDDAELFVTDGDYVELPEYAAAAEKADKARQSARARWDARKPKPRRTRKTCAEPAIVAEVVEDNDLQKFVQWAKENTPYLADPKNIRPLTAEELRKLKERYGTRCIMETIQALENRKDLRKKYSTLYFTLNNWCKNECKRTTNNRDAAATDAKQQWCERFANL